MSALIIISSLSDGFNHEINKQLSSIDGHYRIHNGNQNIDSVSLSIIKRKLSDNEHFLTYWEYTEDYGMIKIKGKPEGILVYGIEEDKLSDIFNILTENPDQKIINNKSSQFTNMIIGQDLADLYNLKKGDSAVDLYNIEKIRYPKLFKGNKIKISNIFNSGFPEYDKLVCFIELSDAKKIFG